MKDAAISKRNFGLFSAICLVVANMIGAGVFTTSGFSLADIGNRHLVLLAWVIGGLIAICGAISYGQLARSICESGGEYLFLSRVVHPLVGFIAGWVSLLAGFTGAIALAATTLEKYAIPIAADERPWWFPNGTVAISAIVVFGLLHALIMHKGVRTQNLVVAVKLLFLFVFAAFAFAILPGDGWPGLRQADAGDSFSIAVFASSLVWISLSYSGFNAAVYVASEVRRGEQLVPIALVVGTAVVTVFYLLLNYIFLYAPSPDSIAGREEVAAIAAQALGGRTWEVFVRFAICLALLSSVSSLIIVGPRVYAKMASDGVFPAFFREVRHGDEMRSPQSSIWLQVLLASLVVAASTLRDLLAYLGFTLSLSAAGTVVCLIVLYRRDPTGKNPLANLLAPFLYVSATVILALIAATQQPWQFGATIITVVSGVAMYFVFRWLKLTRVADR